MKIAFERKTAIKELPKFRMPKKHFNKLRTVLKEPT